MKLFITLCLLGSMSLFTHLAEATGAHGVFRVVKGKVTVKSAQNGQITRARIGAKVLPGDIISTAKDSRAKVVMVDNNEINISPESQVKIEKYEFNPNENKKDVLLNVIYGKVRSKVEQKYDGKTSKYQVKTPSAVAGVRGTDFITGYEYSSGTSHVITFEGRVEFGLVGPQGQILDPVEVVPGQMAELSRSGQPPVLKDVPQENLIEMDQDSNAETSGPQAQTEPAAAGDTPKNESPSSERRPSSTGMIQTGDLPSANAGPPPLKDPLAPTLVPPGVENGCGQACREIIQNGNKNLKIRVQQ